ncbi:Uma2 family endonuclease [Dactylosporangium sp. NPDC048998]|uniref:Uma2 family endonuclease n=1 Tax=Dactylosporangium sp. NPDC048998 TaxID=3363976 RepID=UPI003715159A
MSAESVGRHMPAIATLDDLTAMSAADPHGHRYEISPEGVLSVMPPPDFEHAVIATRLMGWLIMAGWPLERITQAVGLRIPGSDDSVGGRIPDLVVWGKVPTQPRAVWLPVDGVLLVVEIISTGSKAADTVTKRAEYAGAGIAQYWTVDRDASQTVTMYRLAHDGYRVGATMPLAWVLNTAPADYLD